MYGPPILVYSKERKKEEIRDQRLERKRKNKNRAARENTIKIQWFM